MSKFYFGSNLKMYKTIEETKNYLIELQKLTDNLDRNKIEIFIMPSYLALQESFNAVDVNKIKIGAQNIHWENEGQYTGEISPYMLKEIGINFTMIGHSERRNIFKETDEEINKKVLNSLKNNFSVLLCVGENIEEKKCDVGIEKIRKQIKTNLFGVEKKHYKNIIIAYEPVWAIGKDGIPAAVDYVKKMHLEIRNCLIELFQDYGYLIPILYGGSVNLENASALYKCENLNGLYIGRAAWDAKKFDYLIKNTIK